MIRQRTTLDRQPAETLLIKRRFVPVELTVSKSGQYLTFREKVPHNTRRVAGIIITHDAPTHPMYHNRIYVGSRKPEGAITSPFVSRLPDDLIGEESVEYALNVLPGERLYVAQPSRLGQPELILNEQRQQFRDLVEITLRDYWTDFKETYWVWESKQVSLGKITLQVTPDKLDEDV